MNLANCASLSGKVESGIWIRAIQLAYWNPTDPLYTSHTSRYATRFGPGHKASTPFEILYLAENHLVAGLEVGALLGSPYTAGGLVTNPRFSWVYINVQVNLQNIADLADTGQQGHIGSTAQELTGDWRGYDMRSPVTSVPLPAGMAPTQELGETMFNVTPSPSIHSHWEGFLAVSARAPDSKALIVFPDNLLRGSFLTFRDPVTGVPHTKIGSK